VPHRCRTSFSGSPAAQPCADSTRPSSSLLSCARASRIDEQADLLFSCSNVFRHTRATRRLAGDSDDDAWRSACEEAVGLSVSDYFARLPMLDAVIVSPDEWFTDRKAFVRSDDGMGAPRQVDELDLPRRVA